MGLIRIFERNSSSDVRRFEEGLMMAKEGIMEACEIFKDMKEQFGERGGYGERYGDRYGERYGERDQIVPSDRPVEWGERRSRDSRGRYM